MARSSMIRPFLIDSSVSKTTGTAQPSSEDLRSKFNTLSKTRLVQTFKLNPDVVGSSVHPSIPPLNPKNPKNPIQTFPGSNHWPRPFTLPHPGLSHPGLSQTSLPSPGINPPLNCSSPSSFSGKSSSCTNSVITLLMPSVNREIKLECLTSPSSLSDPDQGLMDLPEISKLNPASRSSLDLTSEQINIIQTHPDQNICINAAPGSGKTSTLILRIIHMHRSYGIPLTQICVMTYNRFLAQDIWAKLKHEGINGSSLGWCGTLHGLCYQETHLYNDIQPWITQHQHESHPYPQFKYVIFDEYQDVDPEMARVIEILARQKWLTIVGDERQQIYTYKGADARLLMNLRSDYLCLPLTRSFRCSGPICQVLSKLFPNYPPIRPHRPLKDPMNNSGTEQPKPYLYRSSGPSMYHPEIIEQIVKIVQQTTHRSIAVISPVVRSDVASKFLNDIHSNLKDRTGRDFLCRLDNGSDGESNSSRNNHIITSIHGVKGKEYDLVIILNGIDHPNFFDYPSVEGLSKLFVGLSRARTELHLFEHRYHETTGSLKWISQQDHLWRTVPGWDEPPKDRQDFDDHSKRSWTTLELSRSLNTNEQQDWLARWTEPELINADRGLGQIYGSPELCGPFLEYLVSLKYLRIKPDLKFELYLSHAEWLQLTKKIIPGSVQAHLNQIFDRSVELKWVGRTLRIVSQQDVLGTIGSQNIVSNLIYDQYYQHLDEAKDNVRRLTLEIVPENIQRLWTIFRFIRLTRSNLTGFRTAPLNSEELANLQDYFEQNNLLSGLTLSQVQVRVEGSIERSGEGSLTSNSNKSIIKGKIGLVGSTSLVEVRSYLNRSLDETWLQMTINHALLNNPHINELYIYNPVLGQLWRRKRIDIVSIPQIS